MGDARLDLIAAAARNNAALCDAMCRSHGIVTHVDVDAWVAATRSPPFYPDAVTLTGVSAVDEILARVDDRPGCSIKDSFATLRVDRSGWSVLFEATWIARPVGDGDGDGDGGPGGSGPDPSWAAVDDDDELDAWAAAWRGDDGPDGLFVPALLGQDVVVLAARDGDEVVAGSVVNRHAGVVGLSNVFRRDGAAVDPWAGSLAWIRSRGEAETVVGYESGTDLTAALDHGFEPIGPLRVWRRGDR